MGIVIYVCGPYGAGKTTLVRETRKLIPSLKTIHTYTTRKPRKDEIINNYEDLTFVSKKEYDKIGRTSRLWESHLESTGVYYGCDAYGVNQELKKGRFYINTGPADVDMLNKVRKNFDRSTVIWVDTPLKVANERIIKRDGSKSKIRIASPTQNLKTIKRGKMNADYIFKPTNDLSADIDRFIDLVKSLLNTSV